MNTPNQYWFFIEPYVFVSITKNCLLLYNTLDGEYIESEKENVITLLRELLQVENCGVIKLNEYRYKQEDVNVFIEELRKKYMGDIIDVSLSNGKPVQLLPYFNFQNKLELYKKHNFSPLKNILENLFEINFYIDNTVDIIKLISFLKLIPGSPTFNIIGNIGLVLNINDLLSYFDQRSSPKNLLCSYKNVIPLQPNFKNNFSYKISVQLPIDMKQWSQARQLLLKQTLSIEYIFYISSEEDIQYVKRIVKQFQIKKYRLNPIYTGDNIRFFEENVFLTKEDILSTSMTIKDFFTRQALNVYDFGKINIMSNGDAYANLNHSKLGNIYTDNIYEIVSKEIEEGQSWFNIRTQEPCCNCVYQWLCPSPSDYEIVIGRYNLCHIKNDSSE